MNAANTSPLRIVVLISGGGTTLQNLIRYMDAGRLSPGSAHHPGSPAARLLETLDAVAEELGVERSQVCTAWVLTRPEVTSVLGGAESVEHADQIIAGTQLSLPEDARERLDRASMAYSQELEECASGT